MIFLVISLGKVDEDTFVVGARGHTDRCAGEFGRDLIIASCTNAKLGTVVPVSGDRRVVRCLLRQVRYSNGLLVNGIRVGGCAAVGKLLSRVSWWLNGSF